jgi:hypothetical protein
LGVIPNPFLLQETDHIIKDEGARKQAVELGRKAATP